MVRNACDNSFYVLHTGGNGVLGNVLRVNGERPVGQDAVRHLHRLRRPPSNYSVLMRPLILLPGGGGPGGPGGGGGGGGGL